jgi:hypothetical protein
MVMILTYNKYKENIEKLKKDKDAICKLIDDYLLFNGNKYLRNHRPGSIRISNEQYIGCFDFREASNPEKYYPFIISVNYINHQNKKDKDDIHLDKDEFNDIKQFFENPDFYKSTKKYNM